jgi:hypothetical protein
LALIPNASLANSSVTIAGSSVSLGSSISLDTITGLSTTGILKRSGTNALGIAIASDFPTLNQNTTGTASDLSGTPTLPNGTEAITQTAGDRTTAVATDAFVFANAGTPSGFTFTSLTTGFSIAGGTTSKTFQLDNTLEFAGTDSTKMTFPATSATIARTDTAQTFTGTQTFNAIDFSSIKGAGSNATALLSVFQNTNSGATARSQVIVANNTSSALGLMLEETSSGFSGSGITGAPAGTNVNIYSNNATGVSVGTNSISAINIDSSQNIVLMPSTTSATLSLPKTYTVIGTTGGQTINKISGVVNFAGSASSLVVLDSTVSASSLIFCFLQTNDATAVLGNAVAGSGTFTINMKTVPTGTTAVAFLVTN